MKKVFKIDIPEPCHEDWNKMTLVEKGRHCKVCQKDLVDFSLLSNLDLFKIIDSGENICGRFRKDQLNVELSAKMSYQLPRLGVVFSFSSLLALVPPAVAQNDSLVTQPKTEINHLKIDEKQPDSDSSVYIIGCLTDSSGAEIPFATIHFMEGDSIFKSIKSDISGRYMLEISSDFIGKAVSLKFKSIGFLEEELTFVVDNKNEIIIDFCLEKAEKPAILGSVVLVRSPIIKKRKSFFNRFRRKSKKGY